MFWPEARCYAPSARARPTLCALTLPASSRGSTTACPRPTTGASVKQPRGCRPGGRRHSWPCPGVKPAGVVVDVPVALYLTAEAGIALRHRAWRGRGPWALVHGHGQRGERASCCTRGRRRPGAAPVLSNGRHHAKGGVNRRMAQAPAGCARCYVSAGGTMATAALVLSAGVPHAGTPRRRARAVHWTAAGAAFLVRRLCWS